MMRRKSGEIVLSSSERYCFNETTDRFDVDDIDRADTDAEGGKTAEAKTKRATFKLAQVPYGYYYMYAVANMGNLAELEKDNIQTVDKLKSINLTWEAENWFATEETADGKVTRATKNHQMFGYFTTKENAPAGANRNTEASRVAINKKIWNCTHGFAAQLPK